MTYIKLLTVLTTLALLTACGGAAAPDNTGDTGEVNTTDCTATPFDTNCDADESAITSRQTTCFASATANRRCGVVIAGACVANPFRAETACMADTYLPNRIAECIKGGEADEGKCATITTDAEKNTMITSCLKNPFDIVCRATVADFATYTDTARMNRLDFCDNNANVANDFCTGNNLVIICEADPFNAICFTDDTYFPNRVNNCITAGNAGESKCNTLLTDTAMNTELTDCLTNPFATACESVTAFTSFALARTNRASFCDNSDNITNTLCMGDVVSPICGLDPFNAICFTEPTYLTARFNNCITAGNAGDNKCDTIVSDSTMNTAITACLTNPFSSACEASESAFTTYAKTAQTNRVSFCASDSTGSSLCTSLTACQGNPFGAGCGAYFESAKIPHCAIRGNKDNGECTTTLSRPNAATWAQSFATELRAAPTAENQFLLGTADGIGRGQAALAARKSLNLKTSEYNSVAFDGDAEDGVEFFSARLNSDTFHYYAGIFSGTNLGAPITGTSGQTATWNGRISALGSISVDSDFNLTVTFGGTGDIAGTLTAFTRATDSISFNRWYRINAEFDNKGLIIATEGNIVFDAFMGDNPTFSSTPANDGDRASGTLTGLIGEEGAVGVFIVKQITGTSTNVGGFVAAPPVPAAPPPPNPCIAAGDCVDTADWLASLTPTPPDLPETPRKNQFLKGTSTGFADRANLNIRDVDGLPLVVTTIRTIPFANTDIAAGGAAFFGGELYNGDNASGNDFYYAGVLAGTNVGAPITEIITAEANIRWTGEIRGNATNSSARFTDGEIANFGLNITFDGNDGGTLKSFFAADTVLHFAIDGTFNANGIITGKVELGNRMGTTSTIRNNNIYSPGTLSGIIGQDGVVGVYYSNNNNAASLDGYSGGFVARPTPSE